LKVECERGVDQAVRTTHTFARGGRIGRGHRVVRRAMKLWSWILDGEPKKRKSGPQRWRLQFWEDNPPAPLPPRPGRGKSPSLGHLGP
jgi:hypothetical protein